MSTFSIPAGYTCPGAHLCKAHFSVSKKQIIDGPAQIYRCYAATNEAVFKSSREMRARNYNLLIQARQDDPENGMYRLIRDSLEQDIICVRLHASGDFFSQDYFDAWMRAIEGRPDVKFYAYTKSHPIVANWIIDRGLPLPDNFQLTLSDGSKRDDLIPIIQAHDARIGAAYAVFHPEVAEKARLPIDHTDQHARDGGHDFALLLHGSQPAGSSAGEALKRMKKENIDFAYSA